MPTKHKASISKQIPESYQENIISPSTKWISAIIIVLLIGGIIIFNLRKEDNDYNESDEADTLSSVSNSLNEEGSDSLNSNDKEIATEKNDSTSESNTSNNSSSAQQNQNVVETKTITETIYIEDADDVSFNYDSTTVKVKDGQIRCVDDDRILQWHEGEKEWDCRKPTHAVFGDLDNNSVNVNSSGELECENDGDFLYWDGGDDQWACGDISGMSSITAGDGLNEASGEVSINAPTCSGTDKLQWNGSAFVCSADVDTDTNTDSQTLSFNSSTGEITISTGNTVDISALTAGTADHNDLNNIQGGATDEYYHLTNSQHGDLTGFLDVLSLPSADGASGQILTTDGSGDLSWTNNSAGVTDHTALSNIGTNDHATIDTHIADTTTNPHSVDSSDVGLGNVDNTSDADKPVSSAVQTALDLKADLTAIANASNWDTAFGWGDHSTAGYSTFSGSYNDLNDVPTEFTPASHNQAGTTIDLDTTNFDTNLSVLDDTVQKALETLDELVGSGGAITSVFGRTGVVTAQTNDYTWAQIDKTTSDIADLTTKSHTSLTDIGSNTHTQLDSHVADTTTNPHSVDSSDVGLGNVDNTSDADKPVSSAVQTALNLKADLTAIANASNWDTAFGWGDHSTAGYSTFSGSYNDLNDVPTEFTPASHNQAGTTIDLDTTNFDTNLSVLDDTVQKALETLDELVGSGGAITSVFGRTGVVTAQTNDYTWAQIDKTTSDIADLTTKSHTSLTDIGSNTHTQLDSHVADTTTNPHSVDSSDVGLGNVDNTSDADKPVSSAVQTALNLKLNITDFSTNFDSNFSSKTTDDLTEGSTNLYDKTVAFTGGTNVTLGGTYPDFTISDNSASSGDLTSHTGDSSIHFTEGSIDHANIQNIGTNDHATIDTHIANITTNPHSVDSSDVGLGNVDNTSDADKPVSTAVQTALNLKADITQLHDAVTLAGKDYLTLSGQEITANQIDLTDDVTGILPIANGGTGSITQNFVDLTNPQTVAGVKTFSSFSITPSSAPTTDYQVANKKYVDDNISSGAVTSVFTRTGDITAQTNDYTWAQVDKTTSDIADLTTKSHTSLTDIGSNTHTQLDSHVADTTTNPHSVDSSDVGLGNVDNTSDADKPVSSAVQTALNLKADLTNVLELDNTDAFTPDADYEPATKKYVDDNAGGTSTFLGLTDTLGSFTAGSILFTSGSVVTEDNTNFFWDDVTDSLGIGTNSITAKTHIKGATADDTAHALKVDDSANANLFSVKNDGLISFKNYTLPTADGSANQVLKTDGSGALTWQDDISGSTALSLSDTDGDTKIQVEESADEDKIRFDTAGVERMVIDENGDVIITGGILKQSNIYYIYGGFQNKLETINCTVDTWEQLTNSTNDLFSGEANGFGLSNDVMTFINAGHYVGNVSITISGGNGEDFYLRLYNITQGVPVGYRIGATTSGVSNFQTFTLPMTIHANAGDNFKLEVMNTTNSDDLIVRDSVFNLYYVSEL